MQSVLNTVAQNLTGNSNALVPEANRFSLEQVPDLSGKVAVVTGGTEGIGFADAHTLLSKNISKLFILALDKAIFNEATDAIASDLGEAAANKVVWKQCDLSDWVQTGQVAFEIAKETDRIDILINNAARGIMTYQLAPTNGIDQHMATNHMGHVVFTSHLLPVLKKTAEAGHTVRIVNLASNAHQGCPSDTQFASIDELNTDLGANGQYGRSKLATLLYSKYLAKHLTSSHPRILANAVHPGVVETRQSSEHILEPFPVLGQLMRYPMSLIKKDQYQGAISTMYCATKTEESGQYVCPPATVEKGTDKANDMQLMERLMKLTREVVREKTEVQSDGKGCPFKDY